MMSPIFCAKVLKLPYIYQGLSIFRHMTSPNLCAKALRCIWKTWNSYSYMTSPLSLLFKFVLSMTLNCSHMPYDIIAIQLSVVLLFKHVLGMTLNCSHMLYPILVIILFLQMILLFFLLIFIIILYVLSMTQTASFVNLTAAFVS